MEILTKKLTIDSISDYFCFFENRAFTDDSPYKCYCQVYQMSKEEYSAVYDNNDPASFGRISKEIATQQIQEGKLQGYLAYVDGVSIGWCNCNNRENYAKSPVYDMPFYAEAKKNEKAVVCFLIAPEFRNKGVATTLLQRAIIDAKDEGKKAFYGFPIVRQSRYEWDYPGPIKLFESNGFTRIKEYNECIILRMLLQ